MTGAVASLFDKTRKAKQSVVSMLVTYSSPISSYLCYIFLCFAGLQINCVITSSFVKPFLHVPHCLKATACPCLTCMFFRNTDLKFSEWVKKTLLCDTYGPVPDKKYRLRNTGRRSLSKNQMLHIQPGKKPAYPDGYQYLCTSLLTNNFSHQLGFNDGMFLCFFCLHFLYGSLSYLPLSHCLCPLRLTYCSIALCSTFYACRICHP